MDQAIRLAGKPSSHAGRCVASLVVVILLATVFWSGVLWLATLLIRLSGGFGV